jgi:hypothetical protein
MVKKINAAFEKAVMDPGVQEQLTKAKFPVSFTPLGESVAALKAGDEKVAQIAQLLGIGK